MRLHQNRQQPTGSSGNSLFRLTMAYDGAGRRISKTRWVKSANSQDWERELVTHYTGIGTEVRENFAGPTKETKVVVNMPQSLGRYGIEDAVQSTGTNASQKFEWYLKNHLGSTMLVYGTVASTNPSEADVGTRIAAYDYRAFGEMLELTPPPTDKVTENFTGKELDDEIALSYFGARYLDPMLGMWTSVDPKRQFSSPYLYAGNGYNPVNVIDPDGNAVNVEQYGNNINYTMNVNFLGLADDGTTFSASEDNILSIINAVESFFTGTVTDGNTTYNIAMKVIYNPEAENIVYIKDKIGESTSWATDQYTRKNLDIVCNDRALIFMKSSGFEITTPHEFAHLMGIKDRYTSWRDKNGIKYSKPHKGFKGNIMGSHGGIGLLPIQIQETLKKKSNKYENFDPWNNR